MRPKSSGSVGGAPAARSCGACKRALDLFLVGITAPLWLALGAVVALLVRVKLGSPILFRQKRPGLGGRPFDLVKFRTMTDARGPDGQLLPDDQRLTGFGRWLRATSLDEFPELWNVIKGDMSLVGPRPLLMDYMPLYTPDQARRHEVRPGITGWAQVNGRNALDWDKRFALDVWYVDRRSIRLDLRILLLSIGHVLGRRGISADGHATMPRFRGPNA
jgi:lipopolysaccharide/colanic/teichoic acid biosynthesis glycosyltransferase